MINMYIYLSIYLSIPPVVVLVSSLLQSLRDWVHNYELYQRLFSLLPAGYRGGSPLPTGWEGLPLVLQRS